MQEVKGPFHVHYDLIMSYMSYMCKIFFVSNDCVATEEDNMKHMLNSFYKTKIDVLINMTLIFLVID